MTVAKVVTVVCMALVLVAGAGITATAAGRAASGAASFGPVIERKIAFVSGVSSESAEIGANLRITCCGSDGLVCGAAQVRWPPRWS